MSARPTSYCAVLSDALHRWSNRVAFEHPGHRSYTYRETGAVIAQMAGVLADEGIGEGQGIGVLSQNCSEAWMASLAIQFNGGYYTPLPVRASDDDLAFIAADSDITAIVAHPDCAQRAFAILSRCPTIRRLFTLGPAAEGSDLLEAITMRDTVGNELHGDHEADRMCMLWYTGGTTGQPKGAIHTQQTVLAAIQRSVEYFELPAAIRYLAAAPISHGGWTFIAPTLFSGGSVIIMDTFDAEGFIEMVNQHGVTLAVGVPSMLYAILDAVRGRGASMPTLERFIYGGSPISAARLREAHARFGSIFTQFYGQSEILGAAAILRAAEHDTERPDRLASCGQAVPGVQIALLDESGEPVGHGAVGEMCFRTDSALHGYWKRPDLSAACLAGGWVHSGDLARADEDGFYTIVDRKKDMIISGGFNVYPAEIEQVLTGHPGVLMAAVIGIPHPKWGEAVKAFVVQRPGTELETEKLMAYVRARKGSVNTPKSIEVVTSLPLTAAGKVDKKRLRDRFWTSTERQVN